MRQGELLGLRWMNIDFARKMIVKTHIWDEKAKKLLPGLKTSKKTGQISHEVGMSDLMVKALMDHRAQSKFTMPTDFVFCNHWGEVWNPDTMRDVIKRSMDACGIQRTPRASGAHMFRHTAASYLWAVTGDKRLTSEQLGHADIKTTANLYVHSSDEHRLQSAEILSAPLADFAQVAPKNVSN